MAARNIPIVFIIRIFLIQKLLCAKVEIKCLKKSSFLSFFIPHPILRPHTPPQRNALQRSNQGYSSTFSIY